MLRPIKGSLKTRDKRAGKRGNEKDCTIDGAPVSLRFELLRFDPKSAIGQPHSNSLTGPLIAFHAKCPPAMYRASNPALRSAEAAWHPMWKP